MPAGGRPRAFCRAIAPTEKDEWRGRVVHGEVHDENAFALGGMAPHAGLFGTADDLARLAQMLLWKGVYAQHRIVARRTVELFTRRGRDAAGSSRALGWDTKSPEGSSAGQLFSADSFGHTGFTGTSVWIDPERKIFLILLTNRVHPTRENTMIREVRPAVADAVIRALDPAAAPRRRRQRRRRARCMPGSTWSPPARSRRCAARSSASWRTPPPSPRTAATRSPSSASRSSTWCASSPRARPLREGRGRRDGRERDRPGKRPAGRQPLRQPQQADAPGSRGARRRW